MTQEQSDETPDDSTEVEESTDDEFDVEDFMNDDVDMDSDRLNRSADDDYTRPIAPARDSLSERLADQLHMLDLPEDYIILGEAIIGSLDRDGYFKQDLQKLVNDLVLFENLNINLEEAENVLNSNT